MSNNFGRRDLLGSFVAMLAASATSTGVAAPSDELSPADRSLMKFLSQGQQNSVVGTDHGEAEQFIYESFSYPSFVKALKAEGYKEVALEVDANFKDLFERAPKLSAEEFERQYVESYPFWLGTRPSNKALAMHGAIVTLDAEGIRVVPDDTRFPSLKSRAEAVRGKMEDTAIFRAEEERIRRRIGTRINPIEGDVQAEIMLMASRVRGIYIKENKTGLERDQEFAKAFAEAGVGTEGKRLKIVGAQHVEIPCAFGPTLKALDDAKTKTMVVIRDPKSTALQHRVGTLEATGRILPDAIFNVWGTKLTFKKDYPSLPPEISRTSELVGAICPRTP